MSRRALLIHGLHSSPATWRQVDGWLTDAGWETSAARLLGHDGRGPSPDGYRLTAYVDDLAQLGRWDLVVAHSLGASAATVLAAADPSWTERLVLLDPVWLIRPDERDAIIADQAAELAHTPESLRAAKPHWHPDDVAAKLAAIASVDPEAATRTFTETDAWDLSAAARALSVPTLVLSGDPGVYTMLQPELAREIADANPRVTVTVVSGAGHSPHRDEPDATRRALEDWLG